MKDWLNRIIFSIHLRTTNIIAVPAWTWMFMFVMITDTGIEPRRIAALTMCNSEEIPVGLGPEWVVKPRKKKKK